MRSTLISRRAGDLEAAPFHDLLSDRSCRRDVWLGVSLLVDYRQVGKVVDVLAEILSYSAADHKPECEVYFKRDPHRASPHFWSW